MSQSSKLPYRWVNDGCEPYTKKHASKLRRARGNKWLTKEFGRKVIRNDGTERDRRVDE